MRPSTVLAKQHLRNKVLPRKIKENIAAGNTNKNDKSNSSYRRAKRDEIGGELFLLTDFSFDSIAQFGLGVSVYLIQLGLVGVLTFVCGCILLPSIISYSRVSYGAFWNHDPRLLGSAACEHATLITGITQGCDPSEDTCSAHYRENCELSEATIISDIVMTCFLALVLYFNMGIDEIEDVLDEAVQTAQDYSVVVSDPDADATDPDEWKVFFERYGRVKNISITKKNRQLHKLLLKKHLIMRQLDPRHLCRIKDDVEYSAAMSHLKSRTDVNIGHDISQAQENQGCWLRFKQMVGISRDMTFQVEKLCEVNRRLVEACHPKCSYPACRVFVSFETEREQRLCLRECATSYMESIFDVSGSSKTRSKFRDVSVLNLSESAEPSNIQWDNLESSLGEAIGRRIFCWLLFGGIITALFFAITAVLRTHPTMVSVLISVINIGLPAIFIRVTELEAHIDEDDRQNSLLFKLYGAKLLTSVIFLYVSTGWQDFLNSEAIIAIINVQLGACFSGPLFKLLDPTGFMLRWVVGPAMSTSQSQLNKYWEGSAFMLADRYTEISKVIFISFFYSLLTPVALFIAVLSCIVMFSIDRYLLFRKTKTPPMLDATMANSLREHALFAICVKVWLSSRFIYGWPMDEAYKNNAGEFVKVDKRPALRMWSLQERDWHSSSQRHLLTVYKWLAIIIIIVVVCIVFLSPLVSFIKDFFYSSYKEEESASSDKAYSRVASIIAYCPVVKNNTEVFIAADTSEMLARHLPEVITCFPGEESNLGLMLPEEHRKRMLARVVWYGDPDAPADLEANNTVMDEMGQEQSITTKGILSTALKRRLGAEKKGGLETALESNYRLSNRRAVRDKITITVGNDLDDVAHIDMRLSPVNNSTVHGDDGRGGGKELKHGGEVVPDEPPLQPAGVEHLLGMSRIKKSVLQRKKNNKIDVAPPPRHVAKNNHLEDKTDTSSKTRPVVFMRDEVYLLRQMRKEMLSVQLIQSRGNRDSTFVDFDQFLHLVQRNAPAAMLSPAANTRHQVYDLRQSPSDLKHQSIKFSRTLLRRIFVKFIPLQETLGNNTPVTQTVHKNDSPSPPDGQHLVNWPKFVAFVQSGAAVELASLQN